MKANKPRKAVMEYVIATVIILVAALLTPWLAIF
jgi:hypothetical protein